MDLSAAIGFSQQKNVNKKVSSEQAILSKIAVLLGGRTAEKIFYNNISTGASDDIEKASSLIYNYSCLWGMNKKVGALNPAVMGSIGKNMSADFFDECKIIMDKIEEFVFKTLKKHKQYVERIAKQLLEDETINYFKIKELVPKRLESKLDIDL